MRLQLLQLYSRVLYEQVDKEKLANGWIAIFRRREDLNGVNPSYQQTRVTPLPLWGLSCRQGFLSILDLAPST